MLSLNERKKAAKSKRVSSNLYAIIGREGWLAPAARLDARLPRLERVRILLNQTSEGKPPFLTCYCIEGI
jgi:hypothetical protein